MYVIVRGMRGSEKTIQLKLLTVATILHSLFTYTCNRGLTIFKNIHHDVHFQGTVQDYQRNRICR